MTAAATYKDINGACTKSGIVIQNPTILCTTHTCTQCPTTHILHGAQSTYILLLLLTYGCESNGCLFAHKLLKQQPKKKKTKE